MTTSAVLKLIGTGIGLGIVHVLTGPDHLSAIATLSASNNSFTSFFLGVRWGIGHSTGLLLVGGIFILKDYLQSRDGDDEGDDPIEIPDSLGHFFESLVGLFMICLGVYGLRSAFRKRRELQGGIPFVADPEATAEQVLPESYLEIDTPSYRDDAPTPTADYSNSSSQEELPVEASQNVADLDSYQSITGVAPEPIPSNAGRWQHRCSTKMLALFAGIIHGLAGPGGVLGIIPAVQLHNWKLAICYLGSFCISSTITMGVFACTCGTISSFLGYHKNLDFEIQCFSATLSLIVGILWLVLISIGKLDDIFP